MPDDNPKSTLEQIAEILVAHAVDFIVVGGQAEVLFGSPRVTYDVDLCYRRSSDNLKRLASALRTLEPTLRGAPPDLPFVCDEATLEFGCNFTFDTTLGPLDLLGYLEPLGDYDAIRDRAQTVRIEEMELRVIHIDDLIAIKRHINRRKDQESLMQLLAIKRVIGESEDQE